MPVDPELFAVRMQGTTQHSREELDAIETSMSLAADWMEAVKFPVNIRAGLRQFARSYGRSRPTVEDIMAAIPCYPVYLHDQRKLNLRDTAGLSMLLGRKDPTKLPLIRQFCQTLAAYSSEIGPRAVVQLVQWPHAGTMVLHNAGHDFDEAPGNRFFRVVVDRNKAAYVKPKKGNSGEGDADDSVAIPPRPVAITIEPVGQFTTRLGWRLVPDELDI